MTSQNNYLSFISKSSTATEASAEISAAYQAANPETPPSLILVFASPHFNTQLEDLVERLRVAMSPEVISGCTGQALVHDQEELEDEPCVSVWAAWFSEGSVELSHVHYERETGGFAGLPAKLQATDDVSLILLGEPYSFPADIFVAQINEQHPGTLVLGGMASGGMGPGESRLIANGEIVNEGAVVLALENVPTTNVVSQGCRPIGEHFVITKAEQNEILELGGVKAHQQLKAVYDRLPTRDKDLMRLGFHIGRVVNEYQESFSYGDFLIRNVTGMNSENESVLVGDYFRPGQTVQFHVRDAVTADEDLKQLLAAAQPEVTPKAALLFTCNGRGSRFFENPHHDALAIENQFGTLPVTGFFCQGEIGPVGGQNFLHGYTASIALFG